MGSVIHPGPVDTGLGLHDSPNNSLSPPDIVEHARHLRAHGVTWYKILADGTNKVGRVRTYTEHGIACIVRLYAHRPHFDWQPDPAHLRAYTDAGAVAFECGNEVNLHEEVKEGDWVDSAEVIGSRLAGQWIEFQRRVKEAGSVPLVCAMTPGGNLNHRAVTNAFLEALDRDGRISTLRGAGVAIHNRPHNKPPNAAINTGNPPDDTTYNEYQWYRDAYDAYTRPHGFELDLFATEWGYVPYGHQDSRFPAMNENLWVDYTREIVARFNPAHPRYVGKRFRCGCYWIETKQGGSVWKADALFEHWLHPTDGNPTRLGQWLLGEGKDMITWNRLPGEDPIEPAPPPPPVEEPVPGRVFNAPPWVTIDLVDDEIDEVPDGETIWILTDFRFEDADETGGRHAIYINAPHHTGVAPLEARVLHKTPEGVTYHRWALDKPESEPAGNWPMYGVGNEYSVLMGGLESEYSELVAGMTMPQNQHVCYYLTFALATVVKAAVEEPAPPPPSDPSEELARLIAEAPEHVTIAINPKTALQTRIRQHGYAPVSNEFSGATLVAQVAQNVGGGLKRLYYVRKDQAQPHNVQFEVLD